MRVTAPDGAVPQLPTENAPKVKSTESVKKISSEINGLIFGQNGSSTPSVPLDLFGRGYRWPGVRANGNAAKVSAAVDAELGVGGLAIMSPGGALYQIVPRRAR